MEWGYVVTPVVAWGVANRMQWWIRRITPHHWAYPLMGYGQLPSSHMAMISSMAAFIGSQQGILHPAFGVTFVWVVVMLWDLYGMYRKLNKQAHAINQWASRVFPQWTPVPEDKEYTFIERCGGVGLGVLVAGVLYVCL